MTDTVYQDLQKPTFDLIASFYRMPPDVDEAFVNMLALYEANPAPETAEVLKNKIMGKGLAEEKKAWLKSEAVKLPPMAVKSAREKYLGNMQAVPQGLPTSGQMLTFLDVVPRKVKDALLDCQAAARILAVLENPSKVNTGNEVSVRYKGGKAEFSRSHLDKPFATRIQRLEHITALLASQTSELGSEEQGFLSALKAEAVKTLSDSAESIASDNPEAAERIQSFASSLKVEGKALSAGDILKLETLLQMNPRLTFISPAVSHRIGQIVSKSASCTYYKHLFGKERTR